MAGEAARRRVGPWAGGGGLALAVALWLPWFHRHLSSVFAPVRAERSLSGWTALGGLGGVVLALAGVAVAWGVLARVHRMAAAAPSGFWLVAVGGLALIIEVGATVARVGAHDSPCCTQVVTTTTPSAGLVLALAAAVVVVLAGMTVLLREAAERLKPAERDG